MMKRFDTMLEAAQFAATLCQGWSFAYSDDTYDKESLLVMAETHDQENPADEDSFYVVSPGGSIGYCEEGEAIDWLFMSGSGAGENPVSYTHLRRRHSRVIRPRRRRLSIRDRGRARR